MKKLVNYLTLSVLFTLLFSCKEDELIVPYGAGEPTIEIVKLPTASLFGDSLQYTVNVADKSVDLSTLKVQLLFSEEVVSEKTIRTKDAGEYSGKLYVPFMKNIPNGTAVLKFTLQNVQMVNKVEEKVLTLSRPDFPYLNFISEGKTYRMNKVAPNKYEVTDEFLMKAPGYIESPVVGEFGNKIQFGWENKAVTQGINAVIPFSNSFDGQYTISFNTLTYAASPFIRYAINDTDMEMVADDLYAVDLTVAKDEELVFEGIPNLNEWFIDEDYFRKDGDKYLSNVISGKYRYIANFAKKSIKVEAMNGDALARLNADGTGAIWIIGEGIGQPTVADNQVGWNPDNALCMAPMGGKKYQVTVVAGQSINTDNINFKFFHEKGWNGEFRNTDLTTTSDVVLVGNGTNGRDPGNLGLVAGKKLDAGATYVFVVDLSEGNNKAKLTVTKK
ncbi:DUF5125 domain-containing protein [Sphingobacterium daejeonense]|uniref:DUF5125 domain-containing protein n=1 Tax=Sphingobacterium daejeonense TaxID=371142 RepID=UPI0021A8C5A7|nr:DUF5125 domain-containing protein [Sphingobacterium daejeonense]MCT1529646.1 DUF5125 domain-containing protein [Sphingobacterium daejeonense]